MVPIVTPPEVTLAEWEANGQLQPKSWVARFDESIPETTRLSTVQLANLDPYCTSNQDGEPCLEQSGFKALPQQFVPDPAGSAALDAATPVLWKLFTYTSRYPFLFPATPLHDNIPTTLTRHGLLRAMVLLHADLSDQLFNGDRDERTRARTNADQRRLLFQALSWPPRRRSTTTMTTPPPALDEALWTRTAAVRAVRYWEIQSGCLLAHTPHNMGVNRDGDGDECFHDLLDFMYALQPVVYGAPVSRLEFLGTAKGMLARGEVVVTPLREFWLARGDFEKLVAFLLVMCLEGSEECLQELPRDFVARKDKVVEAFFGSAGGKEEINFLDFDEALSAGTREIMGGEEFVTNEFVSTREPLFKCLDAWEEPTFICSP